MCCALLSLALLALSEVPLDATVETSSGARLQLATLWKRPTVLFYEDRESTDLNLHVKDALAAAGQARALSGAVDIVAVANVAAYDFFPARNFVLAAIRDLERKFGITVYLDFSGSLARPPWSLPSKGSTVVLIDRTGAPRSRWLGKLPPDEVKALLAQLAELLGP